MKLEEHKSTIHMLLYHVASGECEGEDEDSAHDLNNELFDIWDNDAPMLREMNEGSNDAGDSDELMRIFRAQESLGTKTDAPPPGLDFTGSPRSAKRGAKILLLAPRDVMWFEAEDTLVFARTTEGRSLVERTLSDLEGQLGSKFFRAHRGCLVNLDHIAEIIPGDAGTYRIVFRDDRRSSVPLSRRQARRLRELIPW